MDDRTELERMLRRDPPEIPPRYFYDDKGSELFERITGLPEYYPTRTELALLEAHGRSLVEHVGARRLAELGSGAGRKIRHLLDAMDEGSCAMLDINATFVNDSVQRLAADYPHLTFEALHGNFLEDLHAFGPGGGPRLLLFFAGTLGNLYPRNVPPFFRSVREQMAEEDAFLVGVDLVKDEATLVAAYDDAQGVTADFNLNVLDVLNARFGSDFDRSGWEHVALWDAENRWMDLRVRATRATEVRLGSLTLAFEAGDTIRTEISAKYTRDTLAAAAAEGGLRLERWHTDPEERFALALFRRAP